MNVTRCKSCGRKIVFAITEQGKTIPLDLTAPVYYCNWDAKCFRGPAHHYVSHFATCPDASKHSKKKPSTP